jgi:hypothetical protein
MVKERYNEHRLGECGSDVQNVQIFTHDCSGKVLSDDEIVDVYMRTVLNAGGRPKAELIFASLFRDVK